VAGDPRPGPASFSKLLRANLRVVLGALFVIAVAWLVGRWLAPFFRSGR
jgi:hypothetical protein